MKRIIYTLALSLISFHGMGQPLGPSLPTDWLTTITTYNDWSLGANIYANDNIEAFATVDGSTYSEVIVGIDYDFDLPAGSTIDGIEVTVKRRYDPDFGSGTNVKDVRVQMAVGGLLVGTAKAGIAKWASTYQSVIYGTPTDLWGYAWTEADIEAIDFGAGVQAQYTGSGWRYADVDHISVKVYYTVPPLPVELTSFTAVIDDEYVDVEWTTHSETNNDYFVVEKSFDLINFSTVSTTSGAGNSNQNVGYAITDTQPFTGTSYYRLKQVDYDGTVTYSKLESVTFTPTNSDLKFNIHPNPSDGVMVTLESTAQYKSNVDVLVAGVDLVGRTYYTKVVVTSNTGKFCTAMDLNGVMPCGVYVVIGSSNADIYSQVLIIE